MYDFWASSGSSAHSAQDGMVHAWYSVPPACVNTFLCPLVVNPSLVISRDTYHQYMYVCRSTILFVMYLYAIQELVCALYRLKQSLAHEYLTLCPGLCFISLLLTDLEQ